MVSNLLVVITVLTCSLPSLRCFLSFSHFHSGHLIECVKGSTLLFRVFIELHGYLSLVNPSDWSELKHGCYNQWGGSKGDAVSTLTGGKSGAM